jgi:small redox-active disulfide protein 2
MQGEKMKIYVYGSGCATCKKLFEVTKKAVEEMNSDYEVEYVTGNKGMQKIIELGAMKSPVLAVNNKIAMMGFTPDISKIKKAIKKSME